MDPAGGVGADRGQVDAALLPGLGRLAEHPARRSLRAVAGQRRQHPVRAARRLDRQHLSARHRAGLAEIGRGERRQHRRAAGGIGAVAVARLRPGRDARRRQQAGDEVLRGGDGDPGLLEQRQQHPQRGVVPLPQRRDDPRHQRPRRGIDAGGVERRTADMAGEADAVGAAVAQRGDQRAQRLDPEGQRVGQTGGMTLDLADDPGRRGGVDQGRQTPLARDQRQHQPGVRKWRSEACRMKSATSRTSGLSVSSARRRARSWKAPSPCASIW